VCRPASRAEEPTCARTILTALAHRAFRRPVTSADVTPLMAFYQKGRAAGDFDNGIQMAVQAMLVSLISCSGSSAIPSGRRRGAEGASRQRRGAGVAVVVLPLEHDPGR
jgi:hypothetical protein